MAFKNLKARVCQTDPVMLEELKTRIREQIAAILQEELEKKRET
jgi:hypothetical protein